MFTVGETYRIVMRENDEPTTYPSCKIVSVNLPLIKIKQNGEERVLNTGSPAFVSAERMQS